MDELPGWVLPPDRLARASVARRAREEGPADALDPAIAPHPGLRTILHVRRRATRDTAGKIDGLLGTVQNITPWPKAVHALPSSERLLRAICDNIPFAIGSSNFATGVGAMSPSIPSPWRASTSPVRRPPGSPSPSSGSTPNASISGTASSTRPGKPPPGTTEAELLESDWKNEPTLSEDLQIIADSAPLRRSPPPVPHVWPADRRAPRPLRAVHDPRGKF